MNAVSPSRIAALDTGPLLLWLAGRADPRIIGRFKHLSMFRADDFEMLNDMLLDFKSVLTTPHVLTEVSNHAHHLKGPLGVELLKAFQYFAAATDERYAQSSVLSERGEFIRFGIADCALADLSDSATVITDDFRLAGYLESQGKQVINFNHLRQASFFQ